MTNNFLHWLSAALLFGASLVPAAVNAQRDEIRIIHGSNAGAPQDVMLRILADEMQKIAGKRVFVEPTPGASGQVSHAALKRAPADGNTLLAEGTGITSILQLPDHQHEWTDFEPLYRVQLDPFALYVLPAKYKDLAAFINDVKARPEAVRMGGWAIGGPFQIVSMQLVSKFDGRISWIPYDSGGKAVTEVMGGHIEAAMSNISVYPSFNKRTIVLAQSGETRLAAFPEVPTLKELGVNIVRYHWRGLFMKKGTTEPVLETTYALVGAAIKTPRFQTYLKDSATLEGTITRAAMRDMLADQARSDAQVLRQLKLIK
jgi:putative tricarboxylic transport membrane protein